MTLTRTRGLTAVLTALIGLSSCGGGGGGGGGLSTFPASGAYGWIVTFLGEHSGPFLVHPSQPDTAYQFAPPPNWHTSLVSSGTVNTGAQQVTAIQPHTLVYIAGGSVRSLSLQANGEAPASQPPVSGSAEACELMVTANDYANPLNSRLLVARKGALGDCDMRSGNFPGELGNSELRFSTRGELVVTPSGTTMEAPAGVLRDTTTLAPRAWLYTDHVVFWNDGAGTTLPLSPPGTLDPHIVVTSTDRSAIVLRAGGLSVLDFPGGTTINETTLDPSLTAGNNWKPIGYDADAVYLYKSTYDESIDSTNWTVLKITRSHPVASVLASGSGSADFSMGNNLLYVAIQETYGPYQPSRLLRINKAGGLPAQTVYPAFILPRVLTGAAGVHLLELRDLTSIDAAKLVLRTTLRFIDENDHTLYTADQGFPLASVETDTVSFGRSNNTTRFVFAANNAQSYAGAMLTAYDTTTRNSTALGQLPAGADFGPGWDVWAYVNAGPTSSGVGLAARFSLPSGVNEGDFKVFSFDLGTPNSLKYTSVVK